MFSLQLHPKINEPIYFDSPMSLDWPRQSINNTSFKLLSITIYNYILPYLFSFFLLFWFFLISLLNILHTHILLSHILIINTHPFIILLLLLLLLVLLVLLLLVLWVF